MVQQVDDFELKGVLFSGCKKSGKSNECNREPMYVLLQDFLRNPIMTRRFLTLLQYP